MNSKYSISRDVSPDNKRLLAEVNKLNMSASDVELVYARKKVKKLYDKTVSIISLTPTGISGKISPKERNSGGTPYE